MTVCSQGHAASAPHMAGRAGRFAHMLARGGAFLFACLAVARERRRLLALDDRMLKDIGLSRADAAREAGRGFWDLPEAMRPASRPAGRGRVRDEREG